MATVMHSMHSSRLRVAIASSSEHQRNTLGTILEESGLDVIVNRPPDQKFFTLIDSGQVDVLLLDLDYDIDEEQLFLDDLLERSTLPMLFSDKAITYTRGVKAHNCNCGSALAHKLISLVKPECLNITYAHENSDNLRVDSGQSPVMLVLMPTRQPEEKNQSAEPLLMVAAVHNSGGLDLSLDKKTAFPLHNYPAEFSETENLQPQPVPALVSETIDDAYINSLAATIGLLDDVLPEVRQELISTLPPTIPQLALRLPFSYAKRHGVLTAGIEDGRVIVLCKPGTTALTLAEVRRLVSQPLKLQNISADKFESLLQRSYEQDSSEAMLMMGDLGEDMDLFRVASQLGAPEDLLESEDDAPIIRLINALLTEAIKENASDIHIEPFEERLVVRFRVDGVLREIIEPKRVLAPLLVSRIKVMAKLDIAEKRLPQDGRISLRIAGRAVDVRVSTLPSGHGERVVMRLLDKQAGRLDLEQLGMAPAPLAVMDKIIHSPHGIVLVTGPTGSGKTTTLYAVLSRLNDKSRNIMTVEDPIEYFLDGIGQTLVNTKVDMTFARGLRAILRQDPDVVMVGEIRDLETAQIAVQASLTGHLVLSTLHTNSAVGAVSRLRDMGVEPFLLASSLIGVLAQRLVRLLCDHCKRPYRASEADCALLALHPDNAPLLHAAVGCNHCNKLGYRGRTGIYELIPVDDKMREMIHDGSGEQALEKYARTGSTTLREDGMRRVLAGHTTLEEIVRVTRED